MDLYLYQICWWNPGPGHQKYKGDVPEPKDKTWIVVVDFGNHKYDTWKFENGKWSSLLTVVEDFNWERVQRWMIIDECESVK